VGIGSTTPGYTLDVGTSGTIGCAKLTSNTDNITFTSSNQTIYSVVYNFNHSQTYSALSNDIGSVLNVGNNTTQMGQVQFLKSSLGGAYMQFACANTSNNMQPYLRLIPTNTTNADFRPTTDLIVNLGSSSYRYGTVYASNGTIQTSDSSVKNSVALPYGLKELLQMNTIMYKWKSQDDLPDSDPTKSFQYYGFCADELQPLLPELVYNEDPTAPIQMNYSEILPIVVKAIQEQNQMIQALQTRSDTLETQNATLLPQVATLVPQVASLQADDTMMQSTAASLQSQLTAANTTIGTLQGQLTTQQIQIGQLLQRLAAAGIA
jgi:hypothetical protein